MTWYAQHVFAQPRDDVIAAFRSIPQMADAIYHIPHLRDFERDEQVVHGIILGDDGPIDMQRTARHGPKLPEDGLLVIRELCGANDEHCSDWFGADAVLWDGIGDDLTASDDPILDYDLVFAGAPDWWPTVAPPAGTLRQLQTFAVTTKSIIAYYACHTWGGDVECNFGWVWDGHRKSSCFYRGIVAANANGNEETGFCTDLVGTYAVDQFGRRLIVNGDVLTLILLHFGLLLRDGYFELHTRSFPWEKYNLKRNAG